jgi:hypothetical protein
MTSDIEHEDFDITSSLSESNPQIISYRYCSLPSHRFPEGVVSERWIVRIVLKKIEDIFY